jgi:hypothetical protein
MRRALIAIVLLLLPGAVRGSGETPLFASDQVLRAVLSAPISQAYQQKKKETQLYLDGSWSYRQAEEEPIRLSVKIRARGNFRKKTCALAPLQLNLKKKEVENTLFALYSEHHFRTRLVEVAYVDAGAKEKRWQSTNFLIEDVKDMAARSAFAPVEVIASKRSQMDLGQTALVE